MTDVEVAALVVRVAIGAIMVSFGIHQIVNPSFWFGYVPPRLAKLLPTSSTSFMRTHGVGNLTLGFIYLIGLLPNIFDWVVLAWWLSILPFAFYYEWAAGMRDVGIMAGITALIILGSP